MHISDSTQFSEEFHNLQMLHLRRELNNKSIALIVVLAVIVAFALISFLIVSFAKFRRRRLQRDREFDDNGRWSLLNILARKRNGQGRYEQASDNNHDGPAQSHRLGTTLASPADSNRRQRTLQRTRPGSTSNVQSGAPVDRNTSVRSVMTLPAYRATAGYNEQVLGREGERDGVDVIVDLPSAEEEEALREEEMEAIYQIRLARRQQAAEREESRRERREARQRGDSNALAEARARSRAASNSGNFEELRQEVGRIQDQRQRSVSSVSYADLGVARHDGTRIRANSNESERVGLLSDAASIAVATGPGARSPGLHRRERSESSLFSIDGDLRPTSSSITRVYSRTTTPRMSSGDLRAGSSPELVESDLGGEPIHPPEYEDVSLNDDGEARRSTASSNEPPPEYSQPMSGASPALDTSPTVADSSSNVGDTHSMQPTSRGIDDVPQLPNLRISALPAIVIEPTNETVLAQNR
ncbi:hypothetical protein QQS21_003201 [Conoideocrella luteorostrata]|uniref:Uncharacterized protein n=1 Tax=Conoideocrella luteorostrata TaxID=1105319 RepID=A0AAJ0CTP7_9HYPO|nr:hypothetical protein QQS21_003201 [Conoideocrella luteorostrata]